MVHHLQRESRDWLNVSLYLRKWWKVVMGFVALENCRHLATPPLVSRQMTSEKRAQKFHTDDVSPPWSGLCFWLSEANLQRSFRGETTLVASRNVGCFLRLWVLKKKRRQLYASEWGQIKNKFCCKISKNMPNFPLNVTLDTQARWKENLKIIFSERKMKSIYMCITLESSLQSSSKTLVL